MPGVMACWKGEQRVQCGFGVSEADLRVFEKLAELHRFESIFGIGNGFGWSTVALRLLWPQATLTVIDAGTEGPDNEWATNETNAILVGIPPCDRSVIPATSPQDVADTIETDHGAPIDLVFIDGYHSNDQLTLDYGAVEPYLATEHVVLMHDIGFCRMHESWDGIAARYGGRAKLLENTPTGMGVVWTIPTDLTPLGDV